MSDEKKKLTIYINEDVLKQIKISAINQDISLSLLTENLYKEVLSKEKK